MAPSFEYRDEELVSRRREQRIERMRQEKEKQRRRRRLIRKLIPVAGIAVTVIILIIILIIALSGDEEKGADGEQVQNGTQSGISQETGGQAALPTQAPVTQTPATPTAPPATPSPKPVDYSFTEAADVAAIYNSDDMVSTNAILVDVSTDTIVASKGAFEKLSPASMTKVLTVLVAAEQITKEQLDESFTITLEHTDYAYVNDCSTAGFLNEEVVTVRDLFYGTILPSGGEAAVGLAYYIAGSHEAFVEMMNEKLEELGLSDTAHFTNCVGLYDKEHYCTLYDMAIIMCAALDNEICREVLGAHSYTTTATAQHPEGIVISNWFLRRIEDKDTGGEVLCAKTGFVAQSQNCAVSYGTFAGGTPYICVTAGATSSWRCIYDQVEIYNRYVKQRNS